MSQESIDAQKICNAALLNSRVAEAMIMLEGMKAENAQRRHLGQPPAYVESAFEKLRVQSGVCWNDAVTILGNNL